MDKLLGQKIGMTQVYDDAGVLRPVTLVKVGPCHISQIKTVDKDGYSAVQIGFGERKMKRVTRPMQGHFKNANLDPMTRLKEVHVEDTSKYEVGRTVLMTDVFKEGDKVIVSGTSKGKGFQGVVKRHNFKGGPKTHGQSDRLRAPGSIGQSSYPSRVFKGTRMGGRMGNDRVSIKNLVIEKLIPSRNLMMIRGAVPGGKNAIVEVRKILSEV